MKNILLTLVLFLSAIGAAAQPRRVATLARQSSFVRNATPGQTLKRASLSDGRRKVVTEKEPEFIFDPQGEEHLYVMTLFNYDMTNQKFVKARSLKSQVRFDADGKTVYFKDLTCSLKAATWVKGEKSIYKGTEEVGSAKIAVGDTIVRVSFGQPLVYYKSKYLTFFAPMEYTDSTGNMEVQDYFTLVMRGDSLVTPEYPEGVFQGAAGYVYISETTQGCLSFDIDHGMRLVPEKPIIVPEDIESVDYVYTYRNSADGVQKTRVKVKQRGEDIYMQMSTSAPKAYVYGKIQGDSIYVPQPQLITDSTFFFFYSLADPVYKEGTLVDFVPATTGCRLGWSNGEITSSPEVFSVDYMDGMEICMDYVTHPTLTRYGGDVLSKPLNPEWVKIGLDNYFKFVSFNIAALNTDSAYINQDSLYYRLYFNDKIHTFTASDYNSLSESTTDIPYGHVDNFDFYVYGKLHYVYLYIDDSDVHSIGVQSVYKLNGKEACSDIVTYEFDNPNDSTETIGPFYANDLSLGLCRLDQRMVQSGGTLTLRGTVKNEGSASQSGFTIEAVVEGQTPVACQQTVSLAAGKSKTFEMQLPIGEHEVANNLPIYLKVVPANDVIDENAENNADTLYYSVYETSSIQPLVLLEEFTSEACGWCPYGAYRIEQAIKNGGFDESVVWICHHDGYGPDWLTTPESQEYLALYGGNTFAPAWMIDRNATLSDEDYPVFGIPSDESDIAQRLTEAMEQPCFVNLAVDSRYTGNRTASITVKASKEFSFDGQCPNARITVFVVEDSIASYKQKTYDSHSIKYHHNAHRANVTPVWGQPLEWNGNDATATFTYTAPSNQVLHNLKVVAFIHEYDEENVNLRQVFNTSVCRLDPDDTGIGNMIVEKPEEADASFFNLMGQRVQSDSRGLIITRGKKLLR